MPLRVLVWAALLSLAAISGAQKSDWKLYSYPADGFQASYPSIPEITKKEVPTEAGSFDLHTYIVEADSAALFVGVCDYGAKIEGKYPDVLLQGAKNGALQNSNAHLIGEKKITLGAYPGIEFQSASDNAQITARIYVVGRILYQTLVVAPLDKPYPETARFLDSFQLVTRTGN